MSDDTERILNPGKFTSAEPFKETAIHQAKERVIEAAKIHTNAVQYPSSPIDSIETFRILRDVIEDLSKLEGGAEQEPKGGGR